MTEEPVAAGLPTVGEVLAPTVAELTNASKHLQAERQTHKLIRELSEVSQSSNINFLLGAGASVPFLPLLGSIEKQLNNAQTASEKQKYYKEYLTVILPNKQIFGEALESNTNFKTTRENYQNFLNAIATLLIKRKSTILSKQVNLFTTNIDVLLEHNLETLKLEYNDGFYGKFDPIFGLANFKKAIYRRSLHFDHLSEIPVFNVIKMHGSLSWKKEPNDTIRFASKLEHIDENLPNLSGIDFETGYKKLLIVNPEEAKHLESVLNLYYSELLRLYSSELEKENTLLFILGFSMDDTHIREITLRSARSNPTLRIVLCCSETSRSKMEEKMCVKEHSNIQLLTPTDVLSENPSMKFSMDLFNKQVLANIIP